MSSARPKLVQEGKPLETQNNHDNGNDNNNSSRRKMLVLDGSASSSSSLRDNAMDTTRTMTTHGKSKFRMVIGGETDNDELPDDPDQYYHHQHHPHPHYPPNSHNYGRGRGGDLRGAGRTMPGRGRAGFPGRLGNFSSQEKHNLTTRSYYDTTPNPNDHYQHHQNNYPNHSAYHDNHYFPRDDNYAYNNQNQNTSSLKRFVKNPKSQGLVQSRFVIGGEDASNDQEYTNTIDTDPDYHNIHSMEIEHCDAAATLLVVNPTAPDPDPTPHYQPVERMEGIIALDPKQPLVVMDGANVAYAYADAMASIGNTVTQTKREPDCRGLVVASNFFLQANVRVLIVLPAPWFRLKPRAGDSSSDNSLMLTDQLEILTDLKSRGLLVTAPPRDDDDAYALTIAYREHLRFLTSHSSSLEATNSNTTTTATRVASVENHNTLTTTSLNNARHSTATTPVGSAHVLSNDMFRDAMARDADLAEWLNTTTHHGGGGDTPSAAVGGARISFAFCDLGTRNDYGDLELDFIPNPRHVLVSQIMKCQR